MVSQTNEQALEDYIERSRVEGSRYEKGNPADFDREFALDRDKFWRFLETTQAEELEKLKDRPNWQRLILERLDRKIKKDGILSVLKKGQLLKDLSSDRLNELLTITNLTPNGFSILKRVVDNAKHYYSDVKYKEAVDTVLEEYAASF